MICRLRRDLLPYPALAWQSGCQGSLLSIKLHYRIYARQLIFGAGRKRKKPKDHADDKESENKGDVKNSTDTEGDPGVSESANDNTAEAIDKAPTLGHGRILHRTQMNITYQLIN